MQTLVKIFIQKLFIIFTVIALFSLAGGEVYAEPPKSDVSACSGGLLNHEVRYLNAPRKVRLCEEFSGKLVLVVNTASKCAYTDQYEGLEALYSRYKDRGLVIAGFPSNDFGAQEPGTEKQIQNFCRLTYSVNFPMFAKTSVTQANADPIYRDLAAASGNYPRWNFHKYLIGRDGQLVSDFPSHVAPSSERLLDAIEANL
jgi:glutathione peroxidase